MKEKIKPSAAGDVTSHFQVFHVISNNDMDNIGCMVTLGYVVHYFPEISLPKWYAM